MKNTIITSVSALVFLVIGLFIGKSNTQIEIQTIVKTNIVEKPVIEYVDKYITNVVDSVKNDSIDEFKTAEIIKTQLKSAKFVKFDKLPNGIYNINVRVVISDEFKNTVNPSTLKDAIEIEVRNLGLKIDETASYSIVFYASGFDVGNNLYATNFRMVLLKGSYFLSDDNHLYLKPLYVWELGDYGAISKNLFNQKYVLDKSASAMISFRNKYLESKQNEN